MGSALFAHSGTVKSDTAGMGRLWCDAPLHAGRCTVWGCGKRCQPPQVNKPIWAMAVRVCRLGHIDDVGEDLIHRRLRFCPERGQRHQRADVAVRAGEKSVVSAV